MAGGPLEGVRVVDMTTIVVGPICGRTLADQGADVIKVEAPGGDLLRLMARGARNRGMSGKFMNFNRNKRSICLDIKKARRAGGDEKVAGQCGCIRQQCPPGSAGAGRLGFCKPAEDQSTADLLRHRRVWQGRCLLQSPGL